MKCRKRRFRDHAEALAMLRRIAKRSTREKHPIRAYECVYCKGWHITSQADRFKNVDG